MSTLVIQLRVRFPYATCASVLLTLLSHAFFFHYSRTPHTLPLILTGVFRPQAYVVIISTALWCSFSYGCAILTLLSHTVHFVSTCCMFRRMYLSTLFSYAK
jgi:hypothetical protein